MSYLIKTKLWCFVIFITTSIFASASDEHNRKDNSLDNFKPVFLNNKEHDIQCPHYANSFKWRNQRDILGDCDYELDQSLNDAAFHLLSWWKTPRENKNIVYTSRSFKTAGTKSSPGLTTLAYNINSVGTNLVTFIQDANAKLKNRDPVTDAVTMTLRSEAPTVPSAEPKIATVPDSSPNTLSPILSGDSVQKTVATDTTKSNNPSPIDSADVTTGSPSPKDSADVTTSVLKSSLDSIGVTDTCAPIITMVNAPICTGESSTKNGEISSNTSTVATISNVTGDNQGSSPSVAYFNSHEVVKPITSLPEILNEQAVTQPIDKSIQTFATDSNEGNVPIIQNSTPLLNNQVAEVDSNENFKNLNLPKLNDSQMTYFSPQASIMNLPKYTDVENEMKPFENSITTNSEEETEKMISSRGTEPVTFGAQMFSKNTVGSLNSLYKQKLIDANLTNSSNTNYLVMSNTYKTKTFTVGEYKKPTEYANQHDLTSYNYINYLVKRQNSYHDKDKTKNERISFNPKASQTEVTLINVNPKIIEKSSHYVPRTNSTNQNNTFFKYTDSVLAKNSINGQNLIAMCKNITCQGNNYLASCCGSQQGQVCPPGVKCKGEDFSYLLPIPGDTSTTPKKERNNPSAKGYKNGTKKTYDISHSRLPRDNIMNDLIKFQLMHGLSSPESKDLMNALKEANMQAQKVGREFHQELIMSPSNVEKHIAPMRMDKLSLKVARGISKNQMSVNYPIFKEPRNVYDIENRNFRTERGLNDICKENSALKKIKEATEGENRHIIEQQICKGQKNTFLVTNKIKPGIQNNISKPKYKIGVKGDLPYSEEQKMNMSDNLSETSKVRTYSKLVNQIGQSNARNGIKDIFDRYTEIQNGSNYHEIPLDYSEMKLPELEIMDSSNDLKTPSLEQKSDRTFYVAEGRNKRSNSHLKEYKNEATVNANNFPVENTPNSEVFNNAFNSFHEDLIDLQNYIASNMIRYHKNRQCNGGNKIAPYSVTA